VAVQIGPGLTPGQETAITALLNESTLKQAAERAGIGERTLHRWMDDPLFMNAYRKARRMAFGHAIALSQRYAAMAVQTLAKVMTDPAAAHSSKVAAATAVLKFGRDAIELDDLAERVDALERGRGREPIPLVLPPWNGPSGDTPGDGAQNAHNPQNPNGETDAA
jgi:hypothetical protein